MKNKNFKKKYKDKYRNTYNDEPTMIKSSLVGSTHYLSLINNDLVYYGNLNILKTPDFQLAIHKILRDFKILLHMKYDDFWKEIQISDSLKKSLASCLQIFPRKISKEHLTKGTFAPYMDMIMGDQVYKEWCHLMHTVLTIYHRIVCQSRASQKQTIYNDWLFDIPKILNFIDIYGSTFPKIVKQILKELFQKIQYYRDDIFDFVEIIRSDIMDSLGRHLQFEFDQQIIMNIQNFANPVRSFNRNLIKSLYSTYEVYHTLLMYLTFFPRQYSQPIISNSILQLQLLDNYFFYIINIRVRWQMYDDFRMLMKTTMEAIRQVIIKYIIKALDLLHVFLFEHRVKSESVWSNCLKTYYKICEYFVNRLSFNREKEWEQLFEILKQQFIDRKVFPMNSQIKSKLSQKQVQIVQKCIKYEQKYEQRNGKNGKNPQCFEQQQVIQLKLLSIPSYNQWALNDKIGQLGFQDVQINGHNFQDSNFMQQSSLGIMIDDTQIIMEKGSNERPKKQSKIKPQTQKSMLQKQYDDDYQQIDDQTQFFLGMGLEPHFDLYRDDPIDIIKLTSQQMDLSFNQPTKNNSNNRNNNNNNNSNSQHYLSQQIKFQSNNEDNHPSLSFSIDEPSILHQYRDKTISSIHRKSYENNQLDQDISGYSLEKDLSMRMKKNKHPDLNFSKLLEQSAQEMQNQQILNKSGIFGRKVRYPKKKKESNHSQADIKKQSTDNSKKVSMDQDDDRHNSHPSFSLDISRIDTQHNSMLKKDVKYADVLQLQNSSNLDLSNFDTSFYVPEDNDDADDNSLSFTIANASSSNDNTQQMDLSFKEEPKDNNNNKKKKKKRK